MKAETPTRPAEARRAAVALTVAEAAWALLLAWLLLRSGLAKHASVSARAGPVDVLVLVAVGACLALFVFVLVYWQWRLSGRARVRLLLAIYLSLVGSFCGFCWYDVSVRAARLALGVGAPSPLRQVAVQTAAVMLTIGALVLGLAAVVGVLWLERRAARNQEVSTARVVP